MHSKLYQPIFVSSKYDLGADMMPYNSQRIQVDVKIDQKSVTNLRTSINKGIQSIRLKSLLQNCHDSATND